MDWRKIACVNGYVIAAVLYIIYYYTKSDWLMRISGVVLLVSSIALMLVYGSDRAKRKK